MDNHCLLHNPYSQHKFAILSIARQCIGIEGWHTSEGQDATWTARSSSPQMWPPTNHVGAACGDGWTSCSSGRQIGPLDPFPHLGGRRVYRSPGWRPSLAPNRSTGAPPPFHPPSSAGRTPRSATVPPTSGSALTLRKRAVTRAADGREGGGDGGA
jgi:hypothetical protein